MWVTMKGVSIYSAGLGDVQTPATLAERMRCLFIDTHLQHHLHT